MPSNHLIFCQLLLLLPPIFPSIRIFSRESAVCIGWSKHWSFTFSISPSNEYSGLISFSMDWLELLAVQGTLKSLLQYHISKASFSALFMVQLPHPYTCTLTAIPKWVVRGSGDGAYKIAGNQSCWHNKRHFHKVQLDWGSFWFDLSQCTGARCQAPGPCPAPKSHEMSAFPNRPQVCMEPSQFSLPQTPTPARDLIHDQEKSFADASFREKQFSIHIL